MRLNKTLKTEFAHNMCWSSISVETQWMDNLISRTTKQFLLALVTPAQRKMVKYPGLIQELKKVTLNFKFKGEDKNWYDEATVWATFDEPVPMPGIFCIYDTHSGRVSNGRISWQEGKFPLPLTKKARGYLDRIQKLMKDRKEISARGQKLAEELDALLQEFSTTNKLRDHDPELAEQFLAWYNVKHPIIKEKALVPVLAADSMNRVKIAIDEIKREAAERKKRGQH